MMIFNLGKYKMTILSFSFIFIFTLGLEMFKPVYVFLIRHPRLPFLSTSSDPITDILGSCSRLVIPGGGGGGG